MRLIIHNDGLNALKDAIDPLIPKHEQDTVVEVDDKPLRRVLGVAIERMPDPAFQSFVQFILEFGNPEDVS